MRILLQFSVAVFLLLGSNRFLFAQAEFYNRDSSGYTYRIGPVLPKIQQDWQLGTLGRDFTFGFNPSGVNIENYVLSLLNLPDVTTALQASTATDVFNYLLLQSFQSPTEASVLSNATSMMNQKLDHPDASRRSETAPARSRPGCQHPGRRPGEVRPAGRLSRVNFRRVGGEALLGRFRRSIPRHHDLRHYVHNGQDFEWLQGLR